MSTIGTQGGQGLPENNRDSGTHRVESRLRTEFQNRDSDLRASEAQNRGDAETWRGQSRWGTAGTRGRERYTSIHSPLHCPHTSVPVTHPLLPIAVFQVTDVSVIPGETEAQQVQGLKAVLSQDHRIGEESCHGLDHPWESHVIKIPRAPFSEQDGEEPGGFD